MTPIRAAITAGFLILGWGIPSEANTCPSDRIAGIVHDVAQEARAHATPGVGPVAVNPAAPVDPMDATAPVGTQPAAGTPTARVVRAGDRSELPAAEIPLPPRPGAAASAPARRLSFPEVRYEPPPGGAVTAEWALATARASLGGDLRLVREIRGGGAMRRVYVVEQTLPNGTRRNLVIKAYDPQAPFFRQGGPDAWRDGIPLSIQREIGTDRYFRENGIPAAHLHDEPALANHGIVVQDYIEGVDGETLYARWDEVPDANPQFRAFHSQLSAANAELTGPVHGRFGRWTPNAGDMMTPIPAGIDAGPRWNNMREIPGNPPRYLLIDW